MSFKPTKVHTGMLRKNMEKDANIIEHLDTLSLFAQLTHIFFQSLNHIDAEKQIIRELLDMTAEIRGWQLVFNQVPAEY